MSKWLDQYFKVIKGFIPEKEMHNCVGIDIGKRSCKIIEIKRKGESAELVNWALEPVSGNDIAAAVKALLEKLSIPVVSPSTAVSGKGTLVRYIELPRMSADDLRRSFSFEADKYFPFPADQIYTDCFILDGKEKSGKMAVLAAAARKDVVESRIQLLKDLGLQSDFIGLNPLALANVVHELGLPAPGQQEEASSTQEGRTATAILDMGAEVSSLMIMLDRLPAFNRDIFIGGADLTRSLSTMTGVSLQDAEQLKTQPGDRTESVLKAADPVIHNLISEIRLSFDFFVTEKNVPVTRLLLTGGGPMLNGLSELFSKYLDMPVHYWSPLDALVIPEEINDDRLKANAGRLGVALGLALYQ